MKEKQYPQCEEESPMANEPVISARQRRKVRHGLTPTQHYLLKLFAYDDSEELAKEIQSVVSQHLQKKMDEEANRRFLPEGTLNS